MNRYFCGLSGENATPPVEPPMPVVGAMMNSFRNLPSFVVTWMRLALRSAAYTRPSSEKFSVRWPRNSFGIGPPGVYSRSASSVVMSDSL